MAPPPRLTRLCHGGTEPGVDCAFTNDDCPRVRAKRTAFAACEHRRDPACDRIRHCRVRERAILRRVRRALPRLLAGARGVSPPFWPAATGGRAAVLPHFATR